MSGTGIVLLSCTVCFHLILSLKKVGEREIKREREGGRERDPFESPTYLLFSPS